MSKIFRIRETRLQVRKDLNVYRLRPYRSARACPSPVSRIAGDRPRATVCWRFFCPVRDCCGGLVSSPVTVVRGPAVRDRAIPNYRVGIPGYRSARACPSPMSRIAGDRPPRYGVLAFFFSRSGLLRWASIVPGYRSARACPSPVSRIAGDRPPRYGVLAFFCPVRDCCGGPVASPVTVVRGPVPRRCQGLRGTGPRATGCWHFFVPFGIWRSRTTEVNSRTNTKTAEDRPPPYVPHTGLQFFT